MLQGNIEHSIEGMKKSISELEVQTADVFQRIKLMTLKAKFYQRFNMSQKALSITLRTASYAYQNRMAPMLWEAIETVAQVMLSMSEFQATARLLECIIPQVWECEDCELTGACMASTADAYMGMASQLAGKTPRKAKEQMVRALGYLELAENEFARFGNVKRRCEVLAKKGLILMDSGDHALANDCAARYLDVRREIGEAQLR